MVHSEPSHSFVHCVLPSKQLLSWEAVGLARGRTCVPGAGYTGQAASSVSFVIYPGNQILPPTSLYLTLLRNAKDSLSFIPGPALRRQRQGESLRLRAAWYTDGVLA